MELIRKEGEQILLCPQPTNGIVYIKGLIPIPDLPEDLRNYVPLLCTVRFISFALTQQVLGQLGTTTRDHRSLAQQLELYTGGVSFEPSLTVNHSGMYSANFTYLPQI